MLPSTVDDLQASYAERLAASSRDHYPWLTELEQEMTATVYNTAAAGSKVAPVDWDEFVGQNRVKHLLRVSIVASRADNERLGHVLLADPRPGIGKTTLARLIAADLAVPFIEITRPIGSDRLVRLLNDARIDGSSRAVVFLDEVHLLSKSQADSFLSFLEPGGVLETRYMKYRYPGVTVIAATTDEARLRPAFKSRFSIRPVFEPYSLAELAECVSLMGEKLGVGMDDATVEALAGASAGSPRTIRHLVEAARKLQVTGFPYDADSVLDFCGIHRDGLTHNHVRYLVALRLMGGHGGLDVLAAHLGKEPAEVKQLEQLLFERGYVFIEGRRVLSPSGARRVEEVPCRPA